MNQLANERVAYFNGEYVPERDVLISFRDRGFILGDGAFDTARTFGGAIFRLKEHIERFYRTLRYLRLDPGLTPDEMTSISEEVVARNRHLLGPDDDYWIFQRVTRGAMVVGGDLSAHGGPTVIVECTPLPLKARAPVFRDGIEVITPSLRRVPPESLSPQAKTHNYLNLILSDMEVKAHNPEAWAILLDSEGFLSEGMGSNFFLVSEGALYTPRHQKVLGGISRLTVIELAEQLGIPCFERDLELFDAYNADEAFITATSLCLCPVRSVNGVTMREGAIPGPVTKRIMDAFIEFAGFDFLDQYLRQLDA